MSDQATILICDDEPDARAFVEAVLSQTGDYNILTASDGVMGLEKAKEVVPDLIVLDVQMPRKDGFRVFSDLKADDTTEAIKVIMLTGIAEKTGIRFSSSDMGEFYGKEPDAYVEKPIDPDTLSKAVLKVLAS